MCNDVDRGQLIVVGRAALAFVKKVNIVLKKSTYFLTSFTKPQIEGAVKPSVVKLELLRKGWYWLARELSLNSESKRDKVRRLKTINVMAKTESAPEKPPQHQKPHPDEFPGFVTPSETRADHIDLGFNRPPPKRERRNGR
jgi:hypothetical protein